MAAKARNEPRGLWEREAVVRECHKLLVAGDDIGIAAEKLGIRKGILLGWYLRYRESGLTGLRRKKRKPAGPLRTDAAMAEALRREKLVLHLYERLQKGDTANHAARVMKVPMCQLYRWRKAYEAEGFIGLLPKGKGFGARKR